MEKLRLNRRYSSSSPKQAGGLPPLGNGFGSNSQHFYDDDDDDDEDDGKDHRMTRQTERRRRRFRKQKIGGKTDSDKNLGSEAGDSTASRSAEKKKNKRKDKKALLPDEAYDPYDSDPGESYRQHCMRVGGMGTKSCLKLPGFLKLNQPALTNGEVQTEMTAPPSPMTSELGDVLSQTPASLPADLTRARYTLRSTITDGSEKQPTGPSVMELRELRPNNVHINVSHWSDHGARQYMEDRYV